MEAEGFSSLAEAPEWWLTLAVLHEHFKLINFVLADMQGKLCLLERQDLRLEVLRKDIAQLHCIVEDESFDDSECGESGD